MLNKIDHVGIACRNLDEAVSRYCSVFGLTVTSREVNQEQGVREAMLLVASQGEPGPAGPVTVPGGASYIQLLEPLSPDTPVGKFLSRRGPGIHHIGYGVTDITKAMAAISEAGIRLIDERPRHGSLGASIAFLHPADLGGVLTELVEPRRPPQT